MVGIVADAGGGGEMWDAADDAITQILREGGITGLAIIGVLVIVGVIGWRIAGHEKANPPSEHPMDKLSRELRGEIRRAADESSAQMKAISARADAAHARIDAVVILFNRSADR